MTWHYMAPESVKSSGHGKPADVFSLGLVMGEILDYILWGSYPKSRISAVERRLEEYYDNKRDSAQYEPRSMSREEEAFSRNMSRTDGLISEKDMRLLFSVMTAKDPKKRPSAEEAWKFWRGRYFDILLGDPRGDGYPPTCGKCCE